MNNMNARIISFCVLCLFASMVISITACTNGNQEADKNGTMNIDFGENGVIRNGTEYASYLLEKGQKGIISIDISKVSGRLDLDIYPSGGGLYQMPGILGQRVCTEVRTALADHETGESGGKSDFGKRRGHVCHLR